jgi:hypothetical protein
MNKDKLEIVLDTQFGSMPAHLVVKIDDETVFDDILENSRSLKSYHSLKDHYKIQIRKTGKTLDLVKKHEVQKVVIKDVLLNGLSQHPDKFGRFEQRDNPYVKDTVIQGNELSLNGVWDLELPVFRQAFETPSLDGKYLRDTFQDTEIACFGCSFTYGWGLDNAESWPYYLSPTRTKNYAWGGNCIADIVAVAEYYIENYRCDKMLMLLPHPCRLQVKDEDGRLLALLPGRSPQVEKKFPKLNRDIVLYGETSLILSGYVNVMKDIFKEISQRTRLYVSAYDRDLYQHMIDIKDDTFELLPFYERCKEYKFASDGEHPGPDHNRIFAENISKHINLN